MTNNLALWKSVEKTDPDQVKPITGKPYRGTSPKPYYLVQKATETFGPCGIGWGFSIVSERVEDGSAGDRVHIAHIRLWYEWSGKRGELEHVGQTMLAGKNKNGPFTDEDAPKKSVTDALVKALSMIGFAGDIFMGRYDDSKYVQELRDEARQESQSAPMTGRGAAGAGTLRTQDEPAASLSKLGETYRSVMLLAKTKDDLGAWMTNHQDELKQKLGEGEASVIRTLAAARYRELPDARQEAAE
jgi:hypothetical protein